MKKTKVLSIRVTMEQYEQLNKELKAITKKLPSGARFEMGALIKQKLFG